MGAATAKARSFELVLLSAPVLSAPCCFNVVGRAPAIRGILLKKDEDANICG
jgi:hypothetical protein